MYSLARFSLLEMTECSAVLRQLSEQSGSLKDLTARTVNYLYSVLGDPHTGVRDCVLVRCFKTIAYSRLDPATQQIAREKLTGIIPTPDLKCFTLMATAGEQPDWNRVEQSRRYRVIPMVNADFVNTYGNWFTLVSAGFPALGTAVFGIRFQGDFGGDALRSLATADTLRQIDGELRKEVSLSRAADLAEQSARIMLADLDEWRLVNQQRDLSVG